MPVPPDGAAPAADPELVAYLAGHPAPAACADALIRDGLGRVLLVDPTYKDGWDLPGGMLEDEEPARGLVREVREELGVAVEAGRLLAVDTVPPGVYGRTVVAFLYAAVSGRAPLDIADLVLQGSEIREARFVTEDEALALLPAELGRRLAAACAAERGTGTAVLRHGHPVATGACSDEAARAERVRRAADRARAAMVERLEAQGALTDDGLRRALLGVRREVLLPRCYVPRTTGPGMPKAWQLLDGADPRDEDEWLAAVHDGDSVMVQHGGEAPDAVERGRVVVGRGFTAMSTGMTVSVQVLQELRPGPGDRVLEAGTGPGLTAAVLCELVGEAHVTTVEADPHIAEAARDRLARLGRRPTLLCGDGTAGVRGAAFDRITLSFAVRCLPPALLEQLAPGGVLVAPVTTGRAGRAARALVRRTPEGLDAVLRPVHSGHRPGRGLDLVLPPGSMPEPATRTLHRAGVLPGPSQGGFWLAVGHVVPGVVTDRSADGLVLHAPEDASAIDIRMGPTGTTVDHSGPRDLWAEIRGLHGRWVRAGRPEEYRIDLTVPGRQRVTGGSGHPLVWELPDRPLGEPATEAATDADPGAPVPR
ncbi:NUDIX domain-containing protein [Streptomyces sp. NPDC015127]|uniref:NUDIX domain-containing protein n=1 Tax=Streptomyces sp. NPDC015127 TaxID=3364939 RepID=UPI0036FD6283